MAMQNPNNDKNIIYFRSNVSRDILQSSGSFKSLVFVFWEYLINALQYFDRNVPNKVTVIIDKKTRQFRITDTGRGISLARLETYFTNHAPNEDMLAGNPGRGYFGTGSCAAFAVADSLTIRTVHNGLRNTIRFTRSAILAETSGGNVPTIPLEYQIPTTEANGTTVTVADIHGPIDIPAIIKFAERRISRSYRTTEVVINGNPIEYQEPSYNESYSFVPDISIMPRLAGAKLTIKVANAPLDSQTRGIAVLSNGNFFETTLGSVAGKELSQYLFGEIDVPLLAEEGSGPNPAFTMSRDDKLLTSNTLVADIHTFISIHADTIRKSLVDADKARKRTEEAKRLERQASDIAKLLNEDFDYYNDKVERAKQTNRSLGRDQAKDPQSDSGTDLDDIIFGGDEEVDFAENETTLHEHPNNSLVPRKPRPRPFAPDPKVILKENGEPLGRRVSKTYGNKPAQGGFTLEYRNLGVEFHRAEYTPETRNIVINLDFPQVAQAYASDGSESITFKRLSNEIAFTEYAIGISSQMAQKQSYPDPSEYLYDVRATINRLSRKAAGTTNAK